MSVLRLAKQERFCHEYVKDFHAKSAALRAGYRSGHIYETASRLLKDARVRARIAELRDAMARQAKAEAEVQSHAEANWVLAQLVRIAHADPRKFFHADGTRKKVHELDDEEAAALAGFEPTGEAGKVVDRLKVLELLGRHFGLWQQKPAPAQEGGLFDGMSLEDVRRVRDRVGQLLTEAGMDPARSAPRRRPG
ncbi:terminase small subunit [Reyranella sp.]|uniref:terminase small subunit n=1 Tax=Reyranella sp. TaxID=1929291 RepID=UPI003D0E3FDD